MVCSVGGVYIFSIVVVIIVYGLVVLIGKLFDFFVDRWVFLFVDVWWSGWGLFFVFVGFFGGEGIVWVDVFFVLWIGEWWYIWVFIMLC